MGRGWIAGAVALVLAAGAFLLLRPEEADRGPADPRSAGTASKGAAPVKPAGADPAGVPAPVRADGDGGAEGYLLRSLTGMPIPGTATATTMAGAVVSAAAGADGIVRLRGLPRGEDVSIEFASPGLLRNRMPRASIPLEGTLDLGYVVLGEAQRLDILVVDGTGAPIEGCALTVLATQWRPAAEAVAAPEVPEAEAATDAAGRAAFPDLPPGPWLVRAFAAGRARAALSVNLVEGAIREPYRLILAPGFSLEGRVLHADGRPAFPATVVAGPGDRAPWFYPPTAVATDAEGRFRMEGLDAGTTPLSVVAFPGVSETVPDVGIPAPGPVEIRLAPRAEVLGRVVDDGSGAPLEGAEVAVRLAAGQGEGRIAEARRTTGADGVFRFPDLPAYRLESVGASKPGYFEVPAPLAPAEVKERELRLRKGAAVRGVVRDGAGAPVSLAWIRLSSWRGRDGIVYHPEVRSDGAGRYEIPGAHPGPGLLEAGGRNRHLPGVPDDTWDALRKGQVPESCGVTVPEGGVVEKDLVLVPDSRVEGRILHGDGTPAPGFVASLESVDSPGGGSTGTASAADGSFVIQDLYPGTRMVVAAIGPSGRVGVSSPFDLVESEPTLGVTVTVAAPASLAGRVLREDGSPAAGASLLLVALRFDPQQPWQWMNRGRRGDPSEEASVPVAADGTFLAEGLSPGPWTPLASAPDCLERRGETVDLGDGEKREGVAILLAPGFAVAGRVLDPAGAPAAGAQAAAARRRSPADGPMTPEERTVRTFERMNGGSRAGIETDAEGRFRIRGLEAGTYEVRAAREGSVPATATAEAGSGEVVLQLGEGFPVQGRAVEQGTGKPAAGVTVSVTGVPAQPAAGEDFEEITFVGGGRTGSGGRSVTTAADGTFELKGLPAGALDLKFHSPDGAFAPKTVRGVAAGTKNLVVEIPRGLTIAGRVEDAGGQPLELGGLSVELSPADSARAGFGSREEEIQAGGAFSLGGLPPGKYRLTLGSRAWNDEGGVYAARTVEVEAGATDLVIPLTRGMAISGKVMNADGTVPKDQDFEVTLHPSGGGETPRGEEWISVDEDGTFRTDPLPGGVPFDIEVRGGESGLAAAAREVLPGATGVLLRLDKGKSIRGKVLDPEGNPLPGAEVSARPARGGGVRAQAEAGSDGAFTLEGLPPGSYRLSARGEEGNFAPVEAEGVVAAGAEGVVVKTGKGFEFRARCVAADGKPLSGALAFVEVFQEGRWEGPMVHPVEDGVLVLHGLPKCRVRARLIRSGQSFEDDGQGMAGPFEVPGEEQSLTLK